MNGKWETLTLIVSLWFYCKWIKWQGPYTDIAQDIRRYHIGHQKISCSNCWHIWCNHVISFKEHSNLCQALQECWLGDYVIEATVSCIQWLGADRVERLSGQMLKELSRVCCVLLFFFLSQIKSYLVFISCTFTFGVRGCYLSVLQ